MSLKEINKYNAEAKEKWGNTTEYKEHEEKSKNITKQEFEDINDRFMNIFSEIGKLKDLSVEDEKVQGKIKQLHDLHTGFFVSFSISWKTFADIFAFLLSIILH